MYTVKKRGIRLNRRILFRKILIDTSIVLALFVTFSVFFKNDITGINFVAGTIPHSCSNSDDGSYWDNRGYSTDPCCGLSCGCLEGGAGCSLCCPISQEGAARDYYCDDDDYDQCFYCTTCTGGSNARCSSRETNECDSDCGGSPQCDDQLTGVYSCTNNINTGGYCNSECVYTAASNTCESSCPGYNGLSECDGIATGGTIAYCNKGGETYFADKCSDTCTGQDRLDNVCRSAGFGAGCTADAACNGLTPNNCVDGIYCKSNCEQDADNDGDGIDNSCDTENTLADCDDGVDNDGDNLCDSDGCGIMPPEPECMGLCSSCDKCGQGALNVCDRVECEMYCGSCYFISEVLGGSCHVCPGSECVDYGNDQTSCENDVCDLNNCAWTGSECCGITNGGVEVCDNIDNDCDGQIDESVTRACQDYTVGVCATSTQVCTAGLWSECQARTAEICDDNLDNDCDGGSDCLDSECKGEINLEGKTCCMDDLGFNDIFCPVDSQCVFDECADDRSKNGYSYDYFCGDSGYCEYDDVYCFEECENSGCCYPSDGTAVCSEDGDLMDVDKEGSFEICCGGDWKGAYCTGSSCSSTDNLDHDCCSTNDCTGMTTGDCGELNCQDTDYACTVVKHTNFCDGKTSGECGVASGTCTTESQGWYASYTCNYWGDNNQCDNDFYCGGSFSCGNSCTDFCNVGCEFCYSICSGFVGDNNPDTLPANINSCIKHGCWGECVL